MSSNGKCLDLPNKMRRAAYVLLLISIHLFAALPTARCEEKLICCGADEVFILDIDRDKALIGKPVWSWRAKDSLAIPADAQKTFATTDECKPIGDFILISSSSGGVALIRRRDKQCLFYAQAKNAHSACLLPDYRVAVASSFGGDELLVYKLETPEDGPAKPIARLPIRGAHGAVWDKQLQRLWALGSDELLLVDVGETSSETQLKIDKQFKLPTPGGHDLSQAREEDVLYVTTNKHAYHFHKKDGRFTPDPNLSNQPKVKSVSEHPKSGEIVYHQGAPDTWWSDTIRFIGSRAPIRLPGRRLYKVRWDIHK